MHLEDEAGVRPDRRGVVGDRGPVRGADLPQPGPRRGQQVGQAETVADLHHLAAADDDLAAAGQRGRRQHQRGRVVVDDVHVFRLRAGRTQRVQGAPAAPGPLPGGQVVLDVGAPGAGLQRRPGRRGQRRAAQVGVQQHPGGVDDRAQRRGAGRQQPGGQVRHVLRRDLTPAGPVLGRGDHLLDRGRAQAADRLGERGLREQRVRARYPPPAVHDQHSSPGRRPAPRPEQVLVSGKASGIQLTPDTLAAIDKALGTCRSPNPPRHRSPSPGSPTADDHGITGAGRAVADSAGGLRRVVCPAR